MKTFEDMKHNIPEGATHYTDETDKYFFAWVRFVGGEQWRIMPDSKVFNEWHCRDTDNVKPIPQTNIETPEEKEVEWSNGDKCSYKDDNDSHTFIAATLNGKCCIRYDTANNFFEVNLSEISKPETPQQREERERLENGQSLYDLVQSIWCSVDSKYTPHPYDSPLVDGKTKEMYARLARAVDYRKEG